MLAAIELAASLPASAQTPDPGHNYYAVRPGDRTLSHTGVTVEALGMDGCDSRRIPAREDVEYYIQHSEPVWLEITPQSGCNAISNYEDEIRIMLNTIDSDTGNTAEGTWFAGVMLDEEDGYGFSVSQLNTLNNAVEGYVGSAPGGTWWSLEGFVASGGNPNGCDWTNAQYDTVIGSGYQAQQVEHQCNINLLNHRSSVEAAVTWNAGYSPGDTQAHASNPVDAPPYVDWGLAYNWSNHWVPT
ncbi:MAG TPA: hypothetical protein VFM08_18070 [Nocardioides sp.]|nr:hypothetical protein [Nocardioides sp.]